MGYARIKLDDLRMGDLLEVISPVRFISCSFLPDAVESIIITAGIIMLFVGGRHVGGLRAYFLYENGLWETWHSFNEKRFWDEFRLVSRFDECD